MPLARSFGANYEVLPAAFHNAEEMGTPKPLLRITSNSAYFIFPYANLV